MALPQLNRRLLAILVLDMAGYSRSMEADEAGTIARLRSLHQDVVEPLLTRYRGRLVKLMGDGAILVFESVVDAVTCAVAIQRALAEGAAAGPGRMSLRIGVNLGDVALIDDDVYGDGVNIAARLQQLCPPGEVVVSGTAYDHLQGKFDHPLEYLGEQQVKNIARPVRAYRVRLDGKGIRSWPRLGGWRRLRLPAVGLLVAASLLGAGLWWFRPDDPGLVAKASIAVLPFANLSGDEATGRLADGITEDIITDLSRWREFDVIARNSTAVYKGKPTDVREIGRDLDVRYVLEGSVQRQEDQIRLTAQLVSAESGAHLWSERWDRPAADVFSVQTEIAQQVAVKIAAGDPMWQAEYAAARRKRPQDLTAYELYLLASEQMDRSTKEATSEAIALLTKAVERDPGLARAWTLLAWAHDLAGNFGADVEASKEAAMAAAKRAVELDSTDAHAHEALAAQLVTAGNYERAREEFHIAMRLNPGSSGLLMTYAGWAAAIGEAEEGAQAADRAIRLDPHFPLWAGNTLRHAFFAVGRYEDALRVVERQPFETLSRIGLVTRAAIYAALDRKAEAKAAVADTLKQYPEVTIEGFIADPEWGRASGGVLPRRCAKQGFRLARRAMPRLKLRLRPCSPNAPIRPRRARAVFRKIESPALRIRRGDRPGAPRSAMPRRIGRAAQRRRRLPGRNPEGAGPFALRVRRGACL